MLSEETLLKYIDGVKYQNEIENEFTTVLSKFDSDNYNVAFVSYKLSHAFDAILIETIGKDKFDWLMWWMFDSEFGTKHYMVTIEDKEDNVSNFSDFYELILK
jgi:hypothetical protein